MIIHTLISPFFYATNHNKDKGLYNERCVKNMKTVSEVTGEMYENEDVVFYRNCVQSAFMISKGAKLIDIFVDGNMKLVFVFDRKDHNRLTPLWINNKKVKERSEESCMRGNNLNKV